MQESSIALIGAALGISPTLAITAVLLARARQLVTIALGWLLVARAPAMRQGDVDGLVVNRPGAAGQRP